MLSIRTVLKVFFVWFSFLLPSITQPMRILAMAYLKQYSFIYTRSSMA